MSTLFFTQYLKNLRTVGAVAPSSRYLAKKMLASVDFDNAELIVEYGPGTGAITTEIVKQKRPGTKLLVIETNEAFHQVLHAEYRGIDNVEIVNESAERVSELLRERGLGKPDYIISGLPFAALPKAISHTILSETVDLLGHSGTFITFQYTLVKKQFFQQYFSDIRITHEMRNIPPAYVFHCANTVRK